MHDLTSVAKVVASLLAPPTSRSESTASPQRQHCYDLLADEGLSPYSHARVVRVFCNADARKEFLSFWDDTTACMMWLEQEMDILLAQR